MNGGGVWKDWNVENKHQQKNTMYETKSNSNFF